MDAPTLEGHSAIRMATGPHHRGQQAALDRFRTFNRHPPRKRSCEHRRVCQAKPAYLDAGRLRVNVVKQKFVPEPASPTKSTTFPGTDMGELYAGATTGTGNQEAKQPSAQIVSKQGQGIPSLKLPAEFSTVYSKGNCVTQDQRRGEVGGLENIRADVRTLDHVLFAVHGTVQGEGKTGPA
ncbi:regulator of chromosome condensation [Culex quinquefasciatus]|uniref:Regulator of chromosome condensation n=1 Tax=Culex quinquefasciatus TaxID=7176 RepID=B0WSH8_CULQU|nr:regulator of chromosome condensation [Culex quinquefasciatus]|eukprot:XP_001852238.1 regulator of chromosome condensation [Culex quinquefasciatus]